MKRIQLLLSLVLLIPLSALSQSYYTISGIVSDAQSGRLLTGIDVVVKDKATGTISDYKGSYILYLNKGEYEICYSANGYLKEKVRINLNDDFVQLVELHPIKKNPHSKVDQKIKMLRNRNKQEVLSDNLN